MTSENAYIMPLVGKTGMIKGFCVRWNQEGCKGETTGDQMYPTFDSAMSLCGRVNRHWRGQILQWPVSHEYTKTAYGYNRGAEIEDYRRLVGVKGVRKRKVKA